MTIKSQRDLVIASEHAGAGRDVGGPRPRPRPVVEAVCVPRCECQCEPIGLTTTTPGESGTW